MNRTRIILLAALMAATPLSQAMAQDNGGRGGRGDREQSQQRRQISEAEALSRAHGRAGGARYVGSRGLRGSSYVFLFERDGRVIEIAVSAYD